jgi:hypothetical protein
MQVVYPQTIYLAVTTCENDEMDEKKEHRRKRLLELLEMTYGSTRGSRSKAANRIGCDKNYLSRALSEPCRAGHKNIGEDFKEKIELGFGLQSGWLDLPLGTPTNNSSTIKQTHPEAHKATESDETTKSYQIAKTLKLLQSMDAMAVDEALGLVQHVFDKYNLRTNSAGLLVPAHVQNVA